MSADDPHSVDHAHPVDHAYSVDAAKRASDAGRLADWITDFLSSPGSDNEALAAELALHGATFFGPVVLALDDLHPLAGPADHDVEIPVPVREWDVEVDAMDESLARGWEPPPLLVSFRHDTFVVEDGNHRHDALRRAGAAHTWAIIAFWNESERAAYAARFGPDARPVHG